VTIFCIGLHLEAKTMLITASTIQRAATDL